MKPIIITILNTKNGEKTTTNIKWFAKKEKKKIKIIKKLQKKIRDVMSSIGCFSFIFFFIRKLSYRELAVIFFLFLLLILKNIIRVRFNHFI